MSEGVGRFGFWVRDLERFVTAGIAFALQGFTKELRYPI